MKISIIGGGIAGLTTAIALNQKGFDDIHIFESSKENKSAGAGINLAHNAMQVYKKLGLSKEILTAGNYTNKMQVTDNKLKPINNGDLTYFEKTFNVKSCAIHRAELQKILLNNIGHFKYTLNKELDKIVELKNGQVKSIFKDETEDVCDILIGADGIHSKVRQEIFQSTEIRNANQICYRGICDFNIPDKHKNELTEIWGSNKRFGFVPISKNKIYWYALTNTNKNSIKENLNFIQNDFPPIVKNIISATTKDKIIKNGMIDLKPLKKWYKRNICLIGDSVHATTPNLGQGACQAIESAYVFAHYLEKEKITNLAFNNYEKTRKRKTLNVTNNSWKAGKIAHWKNPIAISFRNKLMRLTPNKLTQKQLISIFKLEI